MTYMIFHENVYIFQSVQQTSKILITTLAYISFLIQVE